MSADNGHPPFTPPSIEQATREHLDVVANVRHLTMSYATLSTNVARLADAQTVDRITLGRIEKKLNALLLHFKVNP